MKQLSAHKKWNYFLLNGENMIQMVIFIFFNLILGNGLITPLNFAFMLYELLPPIGLKDDNIKYEYDLACF